MNKPTFTRKAHSSIIAAAAALATAFGASTTARAEDWYFAQTGSNFDWSVGNWTNSAGETCSAFSLDDNYHAVGATVRTAGAAFTGGQLVVGSESSSGFVYNKTYTAAGVSYPNLVLVNGVYYAVNANGSDRDARVAGKITVESTDAAPFIFRRLDNNSGLGIRILADMHGGDDAVLKFVGSNPLRSDIWLSGDGGNYAGKIILTSDNPKADATTADCLFYVDSPTAFGGDRTALMADAVKIQVTTFTDVIFTENAGRRINPANCGMTVEYLRSTSAYNQYKDAVRLVTLEDVDIDLGIPISGDMPIRKAGPGRLTLSGDFSATALSCEEGTLVLASQSAIAKVGAANESVWIKSPSAAEFTVDGIAFASGAHIVVAVDGAAAGTCVLGSGCTVAGKLVLSLDADSDIYEQQELCLLKIPSSIKSVTAGDFDFDASTLPFGLPRYDLTVRDIGGGLQGVFAIRKNPVVFRAGIGDDQKYTSTADAWSDSRAMHDGADYAVTNGCYIRVNGNLASESITLGSGATMLLKGSTQNVGVLYAFPGSTIAFSKASDNNPQDLSGNIFVHGTRTNPAVLKPHNVGASFSGTLSGEGVLKVTSADAGNDSYVAFQSSNPGFLGSIVVERGARDVAFHLADASGGYLLGGNLAEFDYKALSLSAGVTLIADESVSLDAANRGILIRNAVGVNVPENAVLTIDEPVTFNGTLTKSGSGTLKLEQRAFFENASLDGVTETPTAGANRLVLSGGKVALGVPEAISNLVVVAGAGALGYDAALDYGALGALPQSIDVSASALSVAIDCSADKFDIPLFTVDSAIADSLLENGKISVFDASRPSRAIDVATVAATDGSGRVTFRAFKRSATVMVMR